MIYILLCILVNTAIILAFRFFPKFNIDSFQAIAANYYVASFLGFQLSNETFDVHYISHQPWLIHVIILGLLFVSLFYLISVTTIVFGVSVSSVANKMSIVIPVMFAVMVYGDSLTKMQLVGVILAIAAVMMVSFKKSFDQASIPIKQWHYLLPIVLFFGCGSIDTLIGFLQKKYTSTVSNEYILSTAFLFAAVAGTLSFLIMLALKKIQAKPKSILVGLLLGIPNFFSMYLVMKSLESGILTSSTFFPVNNMSIVVLGTLISVLVFKETLSKLNTFGIILSVIAIVLIAFM
jgi:hypothetical protein